MRMVETRDNGRQENGGFNNGSGERLNTLEAFHTSLSDIEGCCLEMLSYLPNIERNTIDIANQLKAVKGLQKWCGETADSIADLKQGIEAILARLNRRHPGAEP